MGLRPNIGHVSKQVFLDKTRSRARVGIRGEEKVLKTEVLKHTGWPTGPVVSVVGEGREMILHPLENSEEERGKNLNESRQLVLIFTLVGILLAIYGLIAIR